MTGACSLLYFFCVCSSDFCIATAAVVHAAPRYIIHARVVDCLSIEKTFVARLTSKDWAVHPEVLTVPKQASGEWVLSLRLLLFLVLVAFVALEGDSEKHVNADHLGPSRQTAFVLLVLVSMSMSSCIRTSASASKL